MNSRVREATGPQDESVVRSVLEGRRDDYAVLVRRYQEPFHRFAAGMVGDADAASDLVQDSLVKAYANLKSCKDPSQFGAWAFQILRNRCRDHLKSPRRRHRSFEDDSILIAGGGPAEELERTGLRELLRKALASVPDDHREAFLLRHVHGYSYQEITETLGTSLSAVKMRVHRAREMLRSYIEERGEGTGDVTVALPESSPRMEAPSVTNYSGGYAR